MRVTNVEQNNTNKTWGALKAGALGAGAAALASRFAPLTTEEHAACFTKNVMSAIDNAAKGAKTDEVARIREEFSKGTLNVSKKAFDTFEKHSDDVINQPKKDISKIIKNADDAVKSSVKSLFTRVEKAGATASHIQKNMVKSAAKSSRNIGYFAIMGALVAMTGKILYNTIIGNSDLKQPVQKENEKQADNSSNGLTMADILLEGLGTNTEILLLTKEAKNNQK